MEIPNQLEPDSEEVNKHFFAMQNSVDVINSLNKKPTLDADEQSTISRNKEHLGIMLEKDYIANDPRNKSVFIEAANS